MAPPKKPLPLPSRPDVEDLERTWAYQGYFRVGRYRLRHRRFDGDWSAPLEREVFERGHAVAVLPYDPLTDQVVLLEQYRVGAHIAGFPPWAWEVVAGVIEDGECPEDVARRETQEETGLAVTSLDPMPSFMVSPGACSESVRLFAGRVDARAAGGLHGVAEENEDIRVQAVPAAEALVWLSEGRFCNAPVLVAMQWFALHHERLRARWLGE